MACLGAISSLLVSAIILPSASSIIRSAYCFANSLSCDTIKTSLSFDNFFNVSKTCLPVRESKAPVGSSAIIISGCLIKALAIATRCNCPPDNSLGFRSPKFCKSTSSKIALILSVSAFFPCNCKANAIFSFTEKFSITLYS